MGGNILNMLDRMGLVRQERNYIIEMKPSGVFSLNDANAVMWMSWLACLLVSAAVAFAFFAEYKREATLYLSAGFVVSTTGLAMFSPLGMFWVQIVGVVVIAGTRKRYAIEI